MRWTPKIVTARGVKQIQEILHRRTDLSTFLVHLTRDLGGMSAKERLEVIVEERTLVAASPMGWAADQDDPDDETAQSQRVVCFSEAPLEQAWTFATPIEGRQVQLEPYGVALPKFSARKRGVNPVWYVDMTPGRNWLIAHALDELREQATATGDFHHQPAARVLPFAEPMGAWASSIREFWWEREWRHVGTFHLPPDGCLFLCPEDEIDEFVPEHENEKPSEWNRRKRRFIDPRWGLERIIAHLAGMPKDDVTPF